MKPKIVITDNREAFWLRLCDPDPMRGVKKRYQAKKKLEQANVKWYKG